MHETAPKQLPRHLVFIAFEKKMVGQEKVWFDAEDIETSMTARTQSHKDYMLHKHNFIRVHNV